MSYRLTREVIQSWPIEVQEGYNSRTDAEKGDIKDTYGTLADISPHLNDLLKLSEGGDHIHKQYMADIIRLHQRSNKISKKLRIRLGGSTHEVQHDKDTTIYYTIVITKKDIQNCHQVVRRVATPKGVLYVVAAVTKAKNVVVQAYTSHFFDRYAERLHKGWSREKAVRQYIKDEFMSEKAAPIHLSGVKATMRVTGGVALG